LKECQLHYVYLSAVESGNKSQWRQLRTFLLKKYRLVILNDTTFAERFSLRLSPWGLIIGAMAITIVMCTAVTSLVAFTPLREYIPGYGTVFERKLILRFNQKADSLEDALAARDSYLQSVLNALAEKSESVPSRPKRDTTGRYKKLEIRPTAGDLQFRKSYEQARLSAEGSIARMKYAGLSELVFFTPVTGFVVNGFDILEDHFGVDIATREEETIKSTLDGTIVFSGYSATDGNVVQVQHGSNLISIYKHCSAVLKPTGERVKSGEAIAVVGNSGERSNGPHLHFELWFNGSPINPQDFVSF
jgi:murein DD-endopeptidase MepM/ murein hydrolase activator NlpD